MFLYPFLDPTQRLTDDEELSTNPAMQAWQEAMLAYAERTGTRHAATRKFWILVRLPANDYADHLEYHETLPMWMPKKGFGEFAGVANSAKEVDKIIESTLDKKTGSNKYVYLVWAAKVQGDQAWRDLLEYCGTNNMLEKY